MIIRGTTDSGPRVAVTKRTTWKWETASLVVELDELPGGEPPRFAVQFREALGRVTGPVAIELTVEGARAMRNVLDRALRDVDAPKVQSRPAPRGSDDGPVKSGR